MRWRWAATPSSGMELNRTTSSRSVVIMGGRWAPRRGRVSNSPSIPSKSPHTTSFFERKYRKKVRREMPAAAAMSSTVVSSKPCRAKRSSAACPSSDRLVTRGRPGRSLPAWIGMGFTLALGAVIVTPTTIRVRGDVR